VVQTTSPIHSHVAFTPVQSCSTLHAATCADAAEFEKAIEHRTVVPYIEPTLLFLVCLHIIWGDFVEEINVFICVELRHLELAGGFRTLWYIKD